MSQNRNTIPKDSSPHALRRRRDTIDEPESAPRPVIQFSEPYADERTRSDAKELDRRVLAAIELLEMDLARDWSVSELADCVGLSTSHFRSVFAVCIGRSPCAYLRQKRLLQAKDLLVTSSLPIRIIMQKVGLPDPSHFSRDFARTFGSSPTQYRRRHGQCRRSSKSAK